MTPAGPDRTALRAAHRMDETGAVQALLAEAFLPPEAQARIQAEARHLAAVARRASRQPLAVEALLREFPLGTPEGKALMGLAEALPRIPDSATADRLILDALGGADWSAHHGHGEPLTIQASAWALEMMPGPVARPAIGTVIRLLAGQFVLGTTIAGALRHAEAEAAKGFRHSFDMLGEAALNRADALRYFEAYAAAIEAVGKVSAGRGPIAGPGVSVKLSALHPRFEFAKGERLRTELLPRLQELARLARAAGIGLTLDAEEADRLEPLLDMLSPLAADPGIKGWEGLGLAVQAYQKRARPLIDWLAGLAKASGRRLAVRLVKGAYWDTEIKRAQAAGLDGYPVFTRKAATDVAYLACARRLFAEPRAFHPAFATHNAHTAAAVRELGRGLDFEFQRLHGMGEALHQELAALGSSVRIYAPVGTHADLLPYLVRRLLENGANDSFVHGLAEETEGLDDLLADPVARLAAQPVKPHPGIPLPARLFGDDRPNSPGLDLSDPRQVEPLLAGLDIPLREAGPIVDGRTRQGPVRDVLSPADRQHLVGRVAEADEALAREAVAAAAKAQPDWDALGAGARAACLELAASLFEEARSDLIALLVREGGKTIPDALAEWREAVDYLHYYAARARADFASPETFRGPTGERNQTRLAGRGVFACISPWNFPLAIFVGQVAAALAAGNAVLAKPAGSTPLVACAAVRLLLKAGVPAGVLHFLPGPGRTVGALLASHPGIGGIAFTGAVATARHLNRSLAARDTAIAPLIAETGGQNAMIADSSALPEQVARDALASAFQSAGQRCSALRVLFLQEDTAPKVLGMLLGAMEELAVGDPALLATDVGPLIDEAARDAMESHAAAMAKVGKPLGAAPLPDGLPPGCHFAPRLFEIDGIGRLEDEVFGPILHVARFKADRLDAVVDSINATGFGLTLGIHSRVESTVARILARARVGNAYVNRNQIGAVVGVQPFGGEGLSGTGPKAGGPRYLHRFAVERTVSVNTAATGGDTQLLNLED